MKTENNNQTEITETTVLLSIPSWVASSTLKSLEDKSIKCEYIGVEESGDLIMKLSYFKWQKSFLEKIIDEMKSDEFVIKLSLIALGAIAVQAYQQNNTMENKPLKKIQEV